MFNRKVIIFTIVAVASIAGCQTQNNSSASNSGTGNERAALIAEARETTHKLVCQDAIFSKSIQEILPNGVSRMQPDQLSTVVVYPSSGKKTGINASNFKVQRTEFNEIKEKLGVPPGLKISKSGAYIFSYDGSENSFVVFVFNQQGVLENIYGYSNSNVW